MKQILGQAVVSTLLATNPQAAGEYIVNIVSSGNVADYQCQPSQLVIRSGDTVTWVNMQKEDKNIPVNISVKRKPKGGDNFVSSDLEKSGDKWSYTFNKSGTYVYDCSTNPSTMPAVITVDRSSQPFEMENVRKPTN